MFYLKSTVISMRNIITKTEGHQNAFVQVAWFWNYFLSFIPCVYLHSKIYFLKYFKQPLTQLSVHSKDFTYFSALLSSLGIVSNRVHTLTCHKQFANFPNFLHILLSLQAFQFRYDCHCSILQAANAFAALINSLPASLLQLCSPVSPVLTLNSNNLCTCASQ